MLKMKKSYILLLALFILPFCASAQEQTVKEADVIRFDKKVHDFGDVLPWRVLQGPQWRRHSIRGRRRAIACGLPLHRKRERHPLWCTSEGDRQDHRLHFRPEWSRGRVFAQPLHWQDRTLGARTLFVASRASRTQSQKPGDDHGGARLYLRRWPGWYIQLSRGLSERR